MKIKVYIDDGRVFEYEVPSAEKAREHAGAILAGGYRHNDGETICEYYPVHRIQKVKIEGKVPTLYPDTATGT